MLKYDRGTNILVGINIKVLFKVNKIMYRQYKNKNIHLAFQAFVKCLFSCIPGLFCFYVFIRKKSDQKLKVCLKGMDGECWNI